MLGLPELADHIEINPTLSDWLVIKSIVAHIVKMETYKPRCILLKQAALRDHAHSLLQLCVPGVMPVAAVSGQR
jgi:hypothetical protein